jgi:hypothetical protein
MPPPPPPEQPRFWQRKANAKNGGGYRGGRASIPFTELERASLLELYEKEAESIYEQGNLKYTNPCQKLYLLPVGSM